MNEFKTYHPIVNFVYFIAVIGFSCALMHPIFLVLSFLCALTYLIILKGKKAVKSMIFIVPLFFTMALINPMFNHEGVTIIAYFPGGNPLTLESVIYGIAASAMITNVILFFNCYNEVMTSDKFVYLFGKVIPTLSLVLSMTLRFVPMFAQQLKIVVNAQKCLGRDISKGNIVKRMKCAISIFSIMVTWSLENAVITADSMKSRGYGLKKRTSYSNYKLCQRDKQMLLYMLILCGYILTGVMFKSTYFTYFPSLTFAQNTIFSLSVFFAYFMLCAAPVIIELMEVRRWKSIKSKI